MVKNDGSLFPKIDFGVVTDHTSFGLDETGQEIHGATYILPRGTLKTFAFIQTWIPIYEASFYNYC